MCSHQVLSLHTEHHTLGWILHCPEDCLSSLCFCCMSQSQACLWGVMGRPASKQVCWQTASDSITQLAAYLCNKSWKMESWSLIFFYRERRFTGGNAEGSWNCLELKGLQGGSPLVNHEPCLLRVFHLFSALQNAGLFLWSGRIFYFFSSDFWINLSSFSWAVRQTDRDRLLVAWAFGSACLLHSSTAQILLTLYLDADILLMVSPLLSTCSWKLLAHLVPFPSEWSSLPGPKRTSTGQKYIWHQALGAAGCALSPKLF